MTIHQQLQSAAAALPPLDLRSALEAHIEACITLLDAIDPDPDLEPSGDEWDCDLAGAVSDREADNSDLERTGDEEPSLGWPEVGEGAQTLDLGGRLDLEEAVPIGFARVRKALRDERKATVAEAQRLRAVVDRLSGKAAGHSNVVPLRLNVRKPEVSANV